MTNLFNIDIDKVRCDGADIRLIKLGGSIIYEYKIIPLYKPYDFKNDTKITEVETMVNESHDNLSSMFEGCTNLTSINTKDWDTTNVITMSYMFSNCQGLTTLDLSNFNTYNVESFTGMFSNCTNLTELDLSNWDTRSIAFNTSMDYMFRNCNSLHTLHLDNCDRSTIINITSTRTGFPLGNIPGVTRTIYCKEENVTGLYPQGSWKFSYID